MRFFDNPPYGKTMLRRTHDICLKKSIPKRRFQRILDLGGGGGVYRPLLDGDVVYNLDIELWKKPDIIGDGHLLPFSPNTFDMVFSMQVLEHCHEPTRIIDEIHRILRPDGLLLMSTVFIYQLHGSPHDYFRFTETGLRTLCQKFEATEVFPLGNRYSAAYDLILGCRPVVGWILNRLVAPFLCFNSSSCPEGYMLVARKRKSAQA